MAAALLVLGALLLAGRLPPWQQGGAPAAGAGQNRHLTILYTGYGRGSVDARRICT